MEIVVRILKIIADYIVPVIAAIGLLFAVSVGFVARKNHILKIKEKIAQKDYVRLILIFISIIFSLIAVINLIAFKIGLTADRFWIIKDYIVMLIFLLGTAELVIKKKKIFDDARIILRNYGRFALFCITAMYLLGAVVIGSYMFGY